MNSLTYAKQLLTSTHTLYRKIIQWFMTPCILGISTIATYYHSLHFPFQFDDGPIIVKYYYLRALTFKQLFLRSTRWVSFWINSLLYQTINIDPWYYRSLNITFHITTGIILYYLCLLLLTNNKHIIARRYAWFIASTTTLLFLLHPVQTQTVSYVVQGQLEGLATLTTLLTLLTFSLAASSESSARKILLYVLMFICAFCATGTKEIAMLIPVLALLLDWFFIAQGAWSSLKERILVHSGLFLFVCGMYVYLLKPAFFAKVLGLEYTVNNNIGNLLTQAPGQAITPYLFFISQFKVVLHYIWMFIWPWNIAVDYDWKLCTSILDLDSILPLMVLLFIIGGVLMTWRRSTTLPILFGAIWFFICLAPRSTIIPSTELLADYKTYGASIGIFFTIALILAHAFERRTDLFRAIALLILGIICASTTMIRNNVWQSGLNFWKDIIEKAPKKARGYNNYAVELIQEKKFAEAIPYLKKAIALEPKTYPDAYTNLSNVYAIQGNYDDAIMMLKKSLTIEPYQPDAYNSLGVLFIEKKEYETAQHALYAAISLSPHFGKPYYNLGRAFRAQKNKQEALKWFKFACTKTDLDREPFAYEAWIDLAVQEEAYDDVIMGCKALYALTRDPKHLFNIGVAYYHQHDYQHARLFLEQCYALNPHNLRLVSNLIECYIKLEDTKKAEALLMKLQHEDLSYPGMEIHEAEICAQQGNRTQAQTILQRCLNNNYPEQIKKKAREVLTTLAGRKA